MHARNPFSESKCWICEDDNGLACFVGDMKGGVRWGAYLRCIPTGGTVGDYVHATCRILCILVKRLRGEFHQRGIHVGVRELDRELHEIIKVCKGIPVKVLPWVVEGAGGLGAGKTSGAGTRGVSLDVVIGGRTGYSNTNGGESSNN